MTAKEFCYWLQGSIELNGSKEFNKEQTKIIKRHLNMVFEHIAHLEEKDQPLISDMVIKHNPKPDELMRC